MRQGQLRFCMLGMMVGVMLAGCGGGAGGEQAAGVPQTQAQVSQVVVKTVLDDQLTYPFGFTLVDMPNGSYKIFLGNTVGGVISSPIGSLWECQRGLLNPQYGEVYSYDSANDYAKRYIKSYSGFIERSASLRQPDGSVDIVFVENRDSRLIKLRFNQQLDSFTNGPIYSTSGARPYDVKIDRLSGADEDIVFSTYNSNALKMMRGDTGEVVVLADNLIENRTVELYAFDGDERSSIITTGLGAPSVIEDPANPTGSVSVLRNQGNYQFVEHRFPIRGAGYARLIKLNTHAPNDLFLVVTHGVRDEIVPAADHGITIYRYDAATNQISSISDYRLPYAYRFDFSDLNGDGVLDIAIGGHDGSGKVTMLLSKRMGEDFSYEISQLDQGLVAVNDLKFHTANEGGMDLIITADDGNGCPRKIGGSRLVKYHFSSQVTSIPIQSLGM